MLKEGRPGLTEEQKADMWRRWKAGYSIREICQALKRNSSPVHAQLAIRGGIAPPGRIRAVVLKLPEREEISRGLGAGESVRSIRSEEHTSELQSPCNLVCRLLLEKKNT